MSEFDPYHRWLGIPSEEQPPHHYRLLGIALFEDQPEVIEHAADRQMAHLRTFQVGPHAGLSQKLLNEVAAAKICLLKAEKKAAYDQFLRERLGGSKQPSAQAGQPPPFPVIPPGEQSPVVELGVPAEEAATATLRRQRWKTAAAGSVAVGLLVGIVVLAAMLAFPPSETLVEDPDPEEKPVSAAAGQQGVAVTVPPASPGPAAPKPSHPDDDDVSEEELAFWQWLLDAESDDSEVASAPPVKPKEPVTASQLPPGPVPMKPEPKAPSPPMPTPDPAVKPPPKKPEFQPEPFKTAAQIDPLLSEAWTLIRRGDHVKGCDKLVQAGKMRREDLRVPFSLGLVHALVTLEWAAAEKEFLQCTQEHPKHVPSLNNLALVRLRLGRESQSIRQWQIALAEGPPPGEIVQNVGRMRYLAQKGRISLKPVTQKALNSLFVDAQRAGDARFDERVGYLYMGLYGGGNPDFGWTGRHDYEDRWCVACNARGTIKCPERDCDRGMVTRMASKFVGINPITKAEIRQQFPMRVPCTVCKTAGFITCPHCTNGKDKQLK